MKILAIIFMISVFQLPLTSQAAPASAEVLYPPYVKEEQKTPHRVTAATPDADAKLRTYTLTSSIEQRDNGASSRTFTELADRPRARSGSLLFDALFAMAMDDARLASVNQIRDDAYAGGKPIPCRCFETGEKWTYVWTRDLAYGADLGLAALDPERVVNALLFKTSAFRAGVEVPTTLPPGSTQIVQDTGSGGSWPVSTDRVAWTLGAEAALASLKPASRATFAAQTYAALTGTIEADREAAFDSRDGLYNGEQSFLDWRTQTYAPWIVDELSYLAQSKALSTNVDQFLALRLAKQLARERSETARAQRYGEWAEALKARINERFWIEESKLYASLTTADRHPVPIHKFDMLGTALAIISGVAPANRARDALAHYPHAPFGVPVYFPQQPDEFVYHNRAIWPFVSAYALRAAAQTHNAAVASHAVNSIMRAAALNLSNMENLEWLTARAEYDDGPNINSRRQLWSIGAYAGMVSESIFGLHIQSDGIRVEPFLTSGIRRALGTADRAQLRGVSYQGKTLNVTLNLPPARDAEGFHAVRSVTLNGVAIRGRISPALLQETTNEIVVSFDPVLKADNRITRIAEIDSRSHTDPREFSPRTPLATLDESGGRARLKIALDQRGIQEAVNFNVYRDGVLKATAISGSTWTDSEPNPALATRCYSVEAVYVKSGHRSHHSRPACNPGGARVTIQGNDVRDWARPKAPTKFPFAVDRDGAYSIRFIYDNHEFAENTGVTNAVKRVRVLDSAGKILGQSVVQMPHIRPHEGKHPLRESTYALFNLKPGAYVLEVSDFLNMSYLQSNERYTYAGGLGGPVNQASLARIEIDRVEVTDSRARSSD
jgi:hypothetical protein